MFVCFHILILLLTWTLIVQHGFTALLAACEYGHDQVVELLIVANAILDLQSNVSRVVYKINAANCTCCTLHVSCEPVDRQCNITGV